MRRHPETNDPAQAACTNEAARLAALRRLGGYSTDLASGIGSKQALAKDLRACLNDDGRGLHLVLQLIRRAVDRAILAFEALLRWTHPEHGPISPADFVPVAERSGLAPVLDRWVLERAAAIRAGWPADGPGMAVNISPSFLCSDELAPAVRQALEGHGLAPSALSIEMTERMFHDEVAAGARAAAALAALGVSVGLDDFGAGHASFAYLKDIPFTKVKIDQSLIVGIDGDGEPARRGRAIVGHVVAIAHAIGGSVVAEGVETEAQFAVLRSLGCDSMQGWLLGRPAAPEFWIGEIDRP
jgi:EAL domain-containing protein (putative c-di-GMP-specific phosphodiesterase class I)